MKGITGIAGPKQDGNSRKIRRRSGKIWRRSFDIAPPVLEEGDKRCPYLQEQYRGIEKSELPLTESLKDTIARAVPFLKRL